MLLVLRLESVFRTGKLGIRLLCVLLSLFLRMFGASVTFRKSAHVILRRKFGSAGLKLVLLDLCFYVPFVFI